MNIFFEIGDSVTHLPGKYLADYDVMVNVPYRYLGTMQASERVWCEDESGVKFIKNRWLPLDTAPVDMKEFFWIKLRSVKI
jgi:hypothetical protein